MSMLSATPGASTSNTHLSYPAPAAPQKPASPPPAAPPRELSKNRLYVGNLHSTVDEYAFLQVFNKFGKIAKLDFLFHKTGPSKGKPRGYAFVEYKDKEDALKALVNAHDKLLRGRKLVVTYANQAPTYDAPYPGSGKHFRRGEVQRPTALSLIKSTSHSGKTGDKIAAFEAKLRQMEKVSKQAASTLPTHPSLPLKPPPSASAQSQPTPESNPGPSSSNRKPPSTAKPLNSKINGIFNSGSSSGLGKKPTLEELIKSRKAGSGGGILKR
ncbi:RNA-binding domain-containing protein [Phellopilus nigrolimitatus]|nr:RNA-binding domain-containing protein [Phellopilus nigrolimitatus]